MAVFDLQILLFLIYRRDSSDCRQASKQPYYRRASNPVVELGLVCFNSVLDCDATFRHPSAGSAGGPVDPSRHPSSGYLCRLHHVLKLQSCRNHHGDIEHCNSRQHYQRCNRTSKIYVLRHIGLHIRPGYRYVIPPRRPAGRPVPPALCVGMLSIELNAFLCPVDRGSGSFTIQLGRASTSGVNADSLSQPTSVSWR